MKFSSRKDPLFTLLIFGIVSFFVGLLISIVLYSKEDGTVFIPSCLLAGIITLLLWVYYGTNYEISANEPLYKRGSFKDKISPKTNESFIKELLKRNAEITLIF